VWLCVVCFLLIVVVLCWCFWCCVVGVYLHI
jgi:hypothetical protein